jgi:hypothetical protein
MIANTKPLSKLLGEVAVLAKVNVSCLGLSRLDKQASSESDANHNAKQGAGKVSVHRLPGSEDPIANIKAKHTAGRALCAGMTTQWGTDRRMLMNTLIPEFSGAMNDIIYEHDQLVAEFVAAAPALIQRAERNLGSYNVTPPTEEEIRNAFSLTFDLSPIPDVSAYSTGDKSLEKQLKMRFEEDVKAAYVGAQNDLLQRLAEPLENLADRMEKYEEREALKEKGIDVGKSGIFKATVITNVTSIAKIVRATNALGDPFLTALADRLDAFEGIEHEDLKNSADLRKDMAKRAKDIRGSLAGWL